MKKPGDMGANPTMQIDVVDLDDARMEALVKTADEASERPPVGRVAPPPLPLVAVMAQPAVASAEPARRSNLVLVVALVACLAVGFAVVAVLRRSNAQATPPATPKPTASVLTIPTVDMSDDTPPPH